jgi:Uma2 family endonuclease
MPVAAPEKIVTIEEYLHSSYDPDREYVDGEVIERNSGEKPHSRTQKYCIGFFLAREKSLGLYCFPEQRIQVKPTRFRIPDVCVYAGSEPDEAIFRTPPFLAIEILSPEDRVGYMQEKIDDYLSFGVAHVWVIDPVRRRGWVHTPGKSIEALDSVMRASNPDVAADLTELLGN